MLTGVRRPVPWSLSWQSLEIERRHRARDLGVRRRLEWRHDECLRVAGSRVPAEVPELIATVVRDGSERVRQILLSSVEREELGPGGDRAVVLVGEENDGQIGVRSQKPDVRRRRGGHPVHDVVRAESPRGGRERLAEARPGVPDQGDALKNARHRVGEVRRAVSVVGEVRRAVQEGRAGAGPSRRALKGAIVPLRRASSSWAITSLGAPMSVVATAMWRSSGVGEDLQHVQEQRHLGVEFALELTGRGPVVEHEQDVDLGIALLDGG